MRLSTPRIRPLRDDECSNAQAALLRRATVRGGVLNIFRTLARTPEALEAFLAWGSYVLSQKNSLPARERELVILRVGYLCRSGYEWAQHEAIGRRAGLSAEEIARIKPGPAAPGWNALDRLLLHACDELKTECFIGDATWSALAAHLNEKQLMDLVYTIGQYTLVSMVLNTFGVPLDTGQAPDPDLGAS